MSISYRILNHPLIALSEQQWQIDNRVPSAGVKNKLSLVLSLIVFDPFISIFIWLGSC